MTMIRGWDGWRMQYTNGRLVGLPLVELRLDSIGRAGREFRECALPGARWKTACGAELQDLGGDLADGLVYCMSASGQWYYSCRNDGHPDASTNGWAPEALRLLERKFGTNTYSWARDTQRGWLNRHCSDNSNNDHRLFGCNYHIEWNYNGGVGKLAGNALVGYGWTQYQDFNDNRGDAVWRMREHWLRQPASTAIGGASTTCTRRRRACGPSSPSSSTLKMVGTGRRVCALPALDQ